MGRFGLYNYLRRHLLRVSFEAKATHSARVLVGFTSSSTDGCVQSIVCRKIIHQTFRHVTQLCRLRFCNKTKSASRSHSRFEEGEPVVEHHGDIQRARENVHSKTSNVLLMWVCGPGEICKTQGEKRRDSGQRKSESDGCVRIAMATVLRGKERGEKNVVLCQQCFAKVV